MLFSVLRLAVRDDGDPSVLAGAVFVMFSLGSLYAWSVYVAPLEDILRFGRQFSGLVFSAATFAFAVGMYIVPYLLRFMSATRSLLWVAIAVLAGNLLASYLASASVLIGYGLVFGMANGVGYGVAIQSVQSTFTRFRGRATGIIVACYALGAACLVPIIGALLERLSLAQTFVVQGFAVAGLIALGARYLAAVDLQAAAGSAQQRAFAWQPRRFVLLWLALFGASCAGIFALGHAAKLATAGIGGDALALAAIGIAIGNGLGRLLGGWSGDYARPQFVIAGLLFLAAAAFVYLAVRPEGWLAIIAVSTTGLGYGWVAGAFPILVARIWGARHVSLVYGRLFTAWGVAAIIGPWFGGRLFDAFNSYQIAVVTAAVVSAAAAVALILVRVPDSDHNLA